MIIFAKFQVNLNHIWVFNQHQKWADSEKCSRTLEQNQAWIYVGRSESFTAAPEVSVEPVGSRKSASGGDFRWCWGDFLCVGGVKGRTLVSLFLRQMMVVWYSAFRCWVLFGLPWFCGVFFCLTASITQCTGCSHPRQWHIGHGCRDRWHGQDRGVAEVGIPSGFHFRSCRW